MHEVNRHKLDRAKAAVDPADELVHARAQVLVLLDVLPTRDGDLDEDDFPDPLGMLVEENLERVHLLRDALDVVEAVDADDDLDAFEATAQGRDARNYGLLLEALGELTGLDPDRERSDARGTTDEFDT